MPPVRVMPEILSNKIAAGEVVERPASVVKELVENAIDAGAARIQVDIEKGGRRLIRVSDNGYGMPRDDALLSIERYATSKLHDDTDLGAIVTLGFRGEALPSIASVSRFTLVTRNAESETGTQLVVHGGRLQDVSAAGAPVGTLVSVEDLFFNTPARRKFLKAVATEMGHVADTLAEIALGWPGIRFRLTHDGRVVKDWAAGEARFRVADVLGRDLDRHLYAVSGTSEWASICGWVAAAGQVRATARGIHVFVNGRCVRDRVIRHALLQGYAGRQVKGQFPVAVLFITVPVSDVDVNVHPTKHEIRFAHPQEIHLLVAQSVSRTLAVAERPAWAPPSSPAAGEETVAETVHRPAISGESFPVLSEPTTAPSVAPSATLTAADPPTQTPLWREDPLAGLRILGQYLDTYILCQSMNRDLILIDQHAAHERIAFERLKNRRIGHAEPSQPLITPETLELGFREAEVLLRMLPTLQAAGLEIDPFGGTTFIVKAKPDLLARRSMSPLIRELVEKGSHYGVSGNLDPAMDDILATMACHSVVRANAALGRDQMRALITALMACADPAHCPHGRPTWVRLSQREIEKRFGRVL